MELAEPLLARRRRSDWDAGQAVGRWYDPDSASFIDDLDRDEGPAAVEGPAVGAYSPVNRGARFSMNAVIPSA
jgi:hypothetical protein